MFTVKETTRNTVAGTFENAEEAQNYADTLNYQAANDTWNDLDYIVEQPAKSYLQTLQNDRAHTAKMCETIATRIVMEGRTDAGDDLHTWTIQRDALDQQIAWINRRTGWAWPSEPAWCN